jgi:hypothetical protein
MCRMHSGNMIASDLPAVRLISETGRNARDPSVSRSASVCVAPTNVSICGTLEVFSVSAHRRHRSRMTYGDLSDPLASVLCGLPSPPPFPSRCGAPTRVPRSAADRKKHGKEDTADDEERGAFLVCLETEWVPVPVTCASATLAWIGLATVTCHRSQLYLVLLRLVICSDQTPHEIQHGMRRMHPWRVRVGHKRRYEDELTHGYGTCQPRTP